MSSRRRYLSLRAAAPVQRTWILKNDFRLTNSVLRVLVHAVVIILRTVAQRRSCSPRGWQGPKASCSGSLDLGPSSFSPFLLIFQESVLLRKLPTARWSIYPGVGSSHDLRPPVQASS